MLFLEMRNLTKHKLKLALQRNLQELVTYKKVSLDIKTKEFETTLKAEELFFSFFTWFMTSIDFFKGLTYYKRELNASSIVQ